MRTTFLIDGFNLYHSLKRASYDIGLGGEQTRWLDLKKLCQSHLYILGEGAELEEIYYFSALARHSQHEYPDGLRRHESYIKCLKNEGVNVILGRFKKKQVWCSNCKTNIKKYEEKETDVSISVTLIKLLMQSKCDSAVIVTGDTDIGPAVKMAQTLFPNKRISFMFPYRRKNAELAKLVDVSFKLSGEDYANNQLPDPYHLNDGEVIEKPNTW